METLDIEINPEYTMLKEVKKGLFLSEEQIEILKSCHIDYMTCTNLKDLIFLITKELEENDNVVLENLLDVIAERDYYENTHK